MSGPELIDSLACHLLNTRGHPWRQQECRGASWVAGRTGQDTGRLTEAAGIMHLVSQQRCADHEISSHVSPWILTKDPCLQSIAICNPESAVTIVCV